VAMGEDRIPSEEECYEIIQRYEMLPNILEHSQQVLKVSIALYDNFRNDVHLNRELIVAAALLHDITKTQSIQTKEPHDRTGAELMRELGFHRIADIVEQHVILKNFDPDGMLDEREIVYYADKRVMHTSIVSVEERNDDIINRYGNTDDRIRLILENKDRILQMERKINRFLKRDVDEILDELK
jgi:uncharacterized protein